MKKLAQKVDKVLAEFKAPPYYPDSPRFHASIAWRLFSPDGSAVLEGPDEELNDVFETKHLQRMNEGKQANRVFASRWKVGKVKLRIGKNESSLRLADP